jgi:CubicO group peptidase (beta-lactamase class C family)
MATLSSDAASDIIKIIDTSAADPVRDIPGVAFHAVNRNGDTILSHASGLRTTTDPLTPMTLDTVFWLASLTKTITGIAVMQLYEQGKADLDSTSQLDKLLPELAKAEILTGFSDSGIPTYQKPKNKMTMRMLLTHTCMDMQKLTGEKPANKRNESRRIRIRHVQWKPLQVHEIL